MGEDSANKNAAMESDQQGVQEQTAHANEKRMDKGKVGAALRTRHKATYKSRSFVWQHLSKIHPEDGSKWSEASCNYCKLVFQCPSDNGTSTLRRHLPKCPKYEKNKDPAQSELTGFSSKEGATEIMNWKFSQEVGRMELARMIIVDELPFSFVEKEGFRRFVSTIQPKFQFVSRTTITKDCFQIYAKERQSLKDFFEKNKSRVAITTDLWTSIQNLGYMCITAHFIDNDWKLQKRIINFRVLSSPHRGEVIAQALEECLLEWGLEKMSTITVDNASSNDVATQILRKKLVKRDALLFGGDFFHVRCFAHILNLVVNDGIEQAKSSIITLRNYIKYMRSSPSRMQAFKKCVELESITCKKMLCLDVPTRWNSTYMMLDVGIAYQKAFDLMEEKEVSFLMEVKDSMSEGDWVVVKDLCSFLEKFYLITKRVSGFKYVTSNQFFREVIHIQALLLNWSTNENEYFKSMAVKMKVKFDKYCNLEKINLFFIVALVLDPRHKLKYVKFCFRKYYSLTGHDLDRMVKKVKDLMIDLYKSYSSLVLEVMEEGSSKGMHKRESVGVSSESSLVEHEEDWEQFLMEEKKVVIKSELEHYLDDGVEVDSPHFDILSWWKMKSTTYRVLSLMARDILAIPISTVASESAFSTGERLLDQFCSSLTPKIVESLVCAQDWLRNHSKPTELEENLDELEKLETTLSVDFQGLSLNARNAK